MANDAAATMNRQAPIPDCAETAAYRLWRIKQQVKELPELAANRLVGSSNWTIAASLDLNEAIVRRL